MTATHPPTEPQPVVPLADQTDIDLYCLECGYNLRGLSGDPRRCPECGHKNPLGDLTLPAPLISEQLRRLETGPTMCVASVLGGLLCLVLTALFMVAGNGDLSCVILASIAFTTVTVLIWSGNVAGFRDSCLKRPGWERALWRFHIYGLSMVLVLIVAVAAFWAQAAIHGQGTWPRVLRATYIAAGIASTGALLLGVPWAYRRAKEDMEPLQREVAVKLAREVLRVRLARQRRGWSRHKNDLSQE